MWQNASSRRMATGSHITSPTDPFQSYNAPPQQCLHSYQQIEEVLHRYTLWVFHFEWRRSAAPYQLPYTTRSTELQYHMDRSHAFGVGSNSQQVREGTCPPMGPPYPQNPMYMGPWGNSPTYTDMNSHQVGPDLSMHYQYSAYNPQQMQQSRQAHPLQTRAQSYVFGLGNGNPTSVQNNVLPPNQNTMGGGSQLLMTMPQGTPSGLPGQSPMSMQYYVPGQAPWPMWPPSTGMRSYSHGSDHSLREPAEDITGKAHAHAAMTTKIGDVNVHGAIIPYEPKKKSVQRRQQRLNQKQLKDIATECPMRVPSDGSGNIHPSCRFLVHKMIRASAKRFLKLTVITFRDHPDEDIQNCKADLEKQFILDDNVRPNYLLEYIESSMKNARYEYHKHWVETGKGEKHEDCPDRIFPQLVKY
ncbi:hypothetical protein KC19_VG062200 [Ceratodon purpureus]|uniref:Uncharacterized protein n=1 Tax=Ceratodon purpureus TaxID=3225 RepID=A0A8T0HN12_CERPU|nr:hypothetical protein KC19_VG062200 [Ceratodon purpureus]